METIGSEGTEKASKNVILKVLQSVEKLSENPHLPGSRSYMTQSIQSIHTDLEQVTIG